MSVDIQSKKLEEWLRLELGYPMELTAENLHRLNMYKMRSVWRHLQAHVKSVSSISTISKNLLLSRLKNQDQLTEKLGNFKVKSVKELSQLQDLHSTQKEINILRHNTNAIEDQIKSANDILLKTLADKECISHKIKEVEGKITFLKLKISCSQKEIEEVNKGMNNACLLNIQPLWSHSELNHGKSLISRMVTKLLSMEIMDEETVKDLVSMSLRYPANTTYDVIVSATSNSFKSLRGCKANLNVSAAVSKLKEKLSVNGNLSFSKHLDNLYVLVYQNHLELQQCLRVSIECSAALDQERFAVEKIINEICGNEHGTIPFANVSMTLVDTLVEYSISSRKSQVLNNLRDTLEAECLDIEGLKWQIGSFGEKNSQWESQITKKVVELNELITEVSTSKITEFQTKVSQRCTKDAYEFSAQLKLQDTVDTDFFPNSVNIIDQEIELYCKTPLIAISRKWEEPLKITPYSFVKDLLKNSSLFHLLLQSEPKNVLKTVLEKICWLKSFP